VLLKCTWGALALIMAYLLVLESSRCTIFLWWRERVPTMRGLGSTLAKLRDAASSVAGLNGSGAAGATTQASTLLRSRGTAAMISPSARH
jgi:hypothetical protein